MTTAKVTPKIEIEDRQNVIVLLSDRPTSEGTRCPALPHTTDIRFLTFAFFYCSDREAMKVFPLL
jgi:hypothetical protein